MRKSIVALAAVAIAAAAAVATYWNFSRAPRFKGPARHVIVLSLDTTRADFLGCYGSTNVKTPVLDALAAESVLLMDYMTAVPTTLGSHTTLFTGKYAHAHGVPRNGFVVNEQNCMLPEILKEHGFQTAGFASSFALDKRFEFTQGFDHWDQEFDQLIGQYGGDQDQRRAERTTDAVIKYLDAEGVPPNLFLFVHYFDPHTPYDPPSPYDAMYDKQGHLGVVDMTPIRLGVPRGDERVMAVARRLALQYAGEISYMDEHIGRLLDYLRKRGVLDDALMIVASDHGESLYDHREEPFDHGLTVFQSTLHGVGMMRLPKAARGGTKLTGLVSSVDVLPTLLSFLKLPIPPGVDGEALDLERLGEMPARTRFSQATKPHESTELLGEWTNARKSRCVREGRWKLVQSPWLNSERLYDVIADPRERRDLLAAATPELQAVAADLRRKLEAWAASANPLPSEYDNSQREETMRRLGGLGYVESGSSGADGDDTPTTRSASQPGNRP